MTQQTSEALAVVLEAEGLPELAARARADEFHDFHSKHVFPDHRLAAELTAAGRPDLRERAASGEFDSSVEEAAAWQDSEDGKETMALVQGE